MKDAVEIRREMAEARANTLRLFADVDDEAFRRQIHPDFSPIGWHLGHIGVTESYWILQRCKQEPSLSVAYDRFFSPTDNPKPHRVHLPARQEILTYLQLVRERVFAFLEQIDFSCDHPLLKEAHIFQMLLQHEEQHNETILLIQQMLAAERYDATAVATREDRAEEDPQPQDVSVLQPPDMVLVPAGPFLMGSDHSAETLDNERPQHLVQVNAFLIDRYPVTNGDFLRFVCSGGYDERSWWSPQGWQWRAQHAIAHPLYWREQTKGRWVEVTRTGVRPLALQHPVMCVSWYEAEAYARFVGKRLPTEAEWEKAASWNPELLRKQRYPWGEERPDAATANFNVCHGGTIPVGRLPASASPYGCQEMCGNVWEWTSTWFQPYPGFFPHPYEGYSVPYFDQQHRVLKGGSWATRTHVLRPTFRNWYHPWVRAIFAGFRCATEC